MLLTINGVCIAYINLFTVSSLGISITLFHLSGNFSTIAFADWFTSSFSSLLFGVESLSSPSSTVISAMFLICLFSSVVTLNSIFNSIIYNIILTKNG